MPIRKLKPPIQTPKSVELLERLAQEMRSPSEEVGEPIIVIDEKADQPIHLYVIWSDWFDLDENERSLITMDAFESAYGPERASRVSVALGFTPREAERFGIEYE